MKEAALHFATEGLGSRSLDAEIYGEELHLAIDAPWAGSTETGFGENLSYTLGSDDAVKLAHWILTHFK